MKDFVQKVSAHPFLEGLRPEDLEKLSEFAMSVQFQPGEVVFRTGDPANRFYLIQSGRVALRSNGSEDVQVIGPGDVLGWSWLFEPYQWHFDAVALEPTWAVFFYGTRLRSLCEADPDFGYELMKRTTRVVIQRLNTVTQEFQRQTTVKRS